MYLGRELVPEGREDTEANCEKHRKFKFAKTIVYVNFKFWRKLSWQQLTALRLFCVSATRLKIIYDLIR